MDIELLPKFTTAFEHLGIERAADRFVRKITVNVPLQPSHLKGGHLEWTAPRDMSRSTRYADELTSSLSELKKSKKARNITVQFRGPGARNGSDVQFQAVLTRLAPDLRELINCLQDGVVEITKEHSLSALTHWFATPTNETVRGYRRGIASLDEAMQVQLSEDGHDRVHQERNSLLFDRKSYGSYRPRQRLTMLESENCLPLFS